jgi:hypothetical protein
MTSNRQLGWVLFLLLLIYPLLMIWQGLDITDTGYSVANYALFFDHYDAISSSSPLWLTMFIGASAESLLGTHFGLIAHRLTDLFLVYINFFIIYKLLNKYFPTNTILIGLLITAFTLTPTLHIFSYQSATFTFYLIAVYFLYFGLIENKLHYIFFGSFFLGLNFFIRLPNLLGLGLYGMLLINYFLLKKSLTSKDLFFQSSLFFLGYAVGFVSILGLMEYLGHLHYFIENMERLLNLLLHGGQENSHSGNSLFLQLLKDLKSIINIGLNIVLIIIFVLFVLNVGERKFTRYKLPYFVMAVLWLFSFYYLLGADGKILYYLYGTVIGILIYTLYDYYKKHSYDLFLLTIFALSLIFLGTLGSDTGLLFAYYHTPLALTLSIAYIVRTNFSGSLSIFKHTVHLNQTHIQFIKYSLISLSSITFLYYGFINVYRDESKNQLLHTINHPRLVNVYTSKERAEVLEDALYHLEKYVNKGDVLLSCDSTPIIYYATQTIPMLDKTWIETLPSKILREKLQAYEQSTIYRPIVFRAKYDTNNGVWPQQKVVLQLQDWKKNRMIIDDFIQRNHYQKVWENEFFEIYKLEQLRKP